MSNASLTRSWSMAAHLAATGAQIVLPTLGFIGPALIWVLQYDNPTVVRHARQALVFQLAMMAGAWLIATIAGMSCLFWWAGVLGVVPWVMGLVFPVVAAARVQSDEHWSYPITGAILPAP